MESGYGKAKKIISTTPANARCFDYDSLKATLDLNLETLRITEDELNADLDEAEKEAGNPTTTTPASEPELPF